jgi:WhiB family transcriptional regulator, redox-sensing transcriptional regulator
MTAIDNRAGWWSDAACLAADPELFFPVSAAGAGRGQIRQAKAVCARCQIQQACLRYAVEAGPVMGIWGGTTEDERQVLRQRERRARGRHARPAVAPLLAGQAPAL